MTHPPRPIVNRLSSCLLVTTLLAVSCVGSARASESTQACLQAYEAGQRSRQEGDLVGAAGEFLVCGGPACPVRMQRDCQRWLDDVERSMPQVVFRVRDEQGKILTDVSLSIDGKAPQILDGRALLMNPGEHAVVFERAGYHPLRTPVFVTEGEKLEPREIALESIAASSLSAGAVPTLASGSPSSPLEAVNTTIQEPARSHVTWPLVLGALGVAGGAGFVYFGVTAKQGESDLERCTPHCSQAQVDDVKRDYLLSNLSLGFSLAAWVGAGVLLLLDQPAASPATAGAPSFSLQLGSTTSWVARF